jgi:hypothetical protein
MPPKDDDPELRAASRTGFEIAINHLIEMGKFPPLRSFDYNAPAELFLAKRTKKWPRELSAVHNGG